MDFYNNQWFWAFVGFATFWLWILLIRFLLLLNFDKKFVDKRPDDEPEELEEDEYDTSSGVSGIGSFIASIVGVAVTLSVGLIVLNQLKDTMADAGPTGSEAFNTTSTMLSMMPNFANFAGIGIVVALAFIVLGYFYNVGSDEDKPKRRKKTEYFENGDVDSEEDDEEDEEEEDDEMSKM